MTRDRDAGWKKDRWVYTYLDANGAPLYVGCSNNLEARHEAHRSTAEWFAGHVAVRSLGPLSARLAFQIETALIKALNPPGNVLHTDRDTRKAGNWEVNLPPGPYRIARGMTATHFASITPHGAVLGCGVSRMRRRELPNEAIYESPVPPTCRSCVRAVSVSRERDGILHGETWMDAHRRMAAEPVSA